MRAGLGFAAVVLTAVLQSAQAQPCIVCRASFPFGNCVSAAMDRPPTGAIAIVGTVAQVDKTQCGNSLTVDVKRSSSSVPARIKIDVGPCTLWGGRTGDEINGMVVAAPRDDGAYQARWCN
jgi:hypothetical protein